MSNNKGGLLTERIVYPIDKILYNDTEISYNLSYIERKVKNGEGT